MKRVLLPALGLALVASLPARAQVNIAPHSATKVCPSWGCGPRQVESAARAGAGSQAGLGLGADLHLEFPLFNRALPNRAQIQATLVYDSWFWGPVNGAWTPAPGTGWWLRSNQGHLLETEETDSGACGWSDGDGDDGSGNIYYYDFSLQEPDGSLVYAGEVMEADPPSGRHDQDYYWDCPSGDALPETLIQDDKGYQVIAGGSPDWVTGTAYDGYGDNVTDGFTDLNGNSITTSGSVVDDPLGWALSVSGAGTPASPIVYSYPGPGGAAQSITVNYAAHNVQSNFGCSYTNYNADINLPSSLVYPDGSTYQFLYDQQGRLSAVTLPGGGQYSYVHALDPVNCASNSFASFLGEWDPTETHEWQWDYNPTTNQTTQTDPYGNATVVTFDGDGNEAEEDDWSGASGSGTELRSAATTRSGTTWTTTTELLWATNLFQQQVETYDTYGFLTASSDSDWYATGAPPLLRQTANTYSVSGNGEVLTSAVVKDGAGNIASETAYANYGNGNPGSETDYAASGTPLTTSFHYNANGALASRTEPNGAATSYGYSGGCGTGFFPTSISDAIGTTSISWDCNGGLPTQIKDYNGQPASVVYDPSWRPSTVTAADGSVTNFSYPASSNGFAQSEQWMSFNGNASSTDRLTVLDSIGRPQLQQTRTAPGSNSFDTVQTCYDEMSRPIFVSAPYSGNLGQTEACSNSPTNPGTTTTYNALSQPYTVTGGDGGTVEYQYAANDVETIVGPAPTGENLKARQEQFDGLGRLESVCEITAGVGSWPGANCGQTTSGSGYLTTYTRNALGEVTGVVQNAQSAATESRSFSFDWLGRLTAGNNPETGNTVYTYDSTSGTCSATSPGDLVMRLDNAGNATCYAYDALHRATQISYPAGPNAGATPTKSFVYDSDSGLAIAGLAGYPASNLAGRLVEAYTGPGTGPATVVGFAYDPMGKAVYAAEETPSSGGWNAVGESYYPNGAVATLALPGNLQISYGLEGEGRPATVGDSWGNTPVRSSSYSPVGLTAVTLGSHDSDAYQRDPTGRMTQYQVTVGGSTATGTVGWNANGSLGSLGIADPIPGATDNGLGCAYTHDDLGRLSEANCASAYDETFSWDPFGNHNSGNTPSGLATSFSFSNNRIAGGDYDSNGNLLEDPILPQVSNQFDAEGRAVSFWGATAVYDALGREVQTGASGSWGPDAIIYAPDGAKLGLMSSGSAIQLDIPLPGGGAAVYNASGLQYYRHADWLGSAVITSSSSRVLLSSTHYTPFGFDETGAGAGYRSFTGAKQLTDSMHTGGQYDFLFREYNPEQGRWWTPDPAGLAAVDPNNPQSWNRYAYANGTPLEATDPQGLSPLFPGDQQTCFWDPLSPACGLGPWNDPWYLIPPFSGGGGGGGGLVLGSGAAGPPGAPANPPAGASPLGLHGGGGSFLTGDWWQKFMPILAGVWGRLPPGGNAAAQAAKQATRGWPPVSKPPTPIYDPEPTPVLSPPLEMTDVPWYKSVPAKLLELINVIKNGSSVFLTINPCVLGNAYPELCPGAAPARPPAALFWQNP